MFEQEHQLMFPFLGTGTPNYYYVYMTDEISLDTLHPPIPILLARTYTQVLCVCFLSQ